MDCSARVTLIMYVGSLCYAPLVRRIEFSSKREKKEKTATNTGCSQENTAACCSGLVEKRGCVLLSRPNLCRSLSAAGFIGHCCLMFINTALSAGVKSALEARFWRRQPSSRSQAAPSLPGQTTLHALSLWAVEGRAAVSQHPWWALDSLFSALEILRFELFSASTRILTFSLRFIGCLTRYWSSVFVAFLAPTLSLLSVFYLTDSHFFNSLCPCACVCVCVIQVCAADERLIESAQWLRLRMPFSTWSLSLIKWKKKTLSCDRVANALISNAAAIYFSIHRTSRDLAVNTVNNKMKQPIFTHVKEEEGRL